MMPVFLASELEGVATFWRLFRRDGVTLGFTSHDRDLAFSGIVHRAAPGMVPSAIRRNTGLASDSAEVEGALSHSAISEKDVEAGRFDGARIAIGVVDWETLAHDILFSGTLGEVEAGNNSFTAELRSAKAGLERDLVPRTSPTCRADFAGPECGISLARFERRGICVAVDRDANAVTLAEPALPGHASGTLRFVDGPATGLVFDIIAVSGASLTVAQSLPTGMDAGHRCMLREGCDHTLATCRTRYDNALNFRGEPYLPGNDLLARYATPK